MIKGVKQNVSLKERTTFKIGGPAKYFLEARNKEDIMGAIDWAKEQGLPFFILGGGSNLLVSDNGFNGLVIKIELSKNEMASKFHDRDEMKPESVQIIKVGAGVKLADLIDFSLKQGLTGLEWAAGIPEATVGGAIKVEAAAFGSSMKALVKKKEVFGRPPVILSAVLQLKKGNKKEIEKEINYVLNYRKENHPMDFPSAGCIFKNPEKVPAAKLIDRCGLKGKKIGGATISEKHANFIVNLGNASSNDVLQLINLVKKEVKNKFGVELEEEIQYLGF